MESMCKADCKNCINNKICGGCKDTKGQPFGKQCFVAKYIQIGGEEKLDEYKKILMDEINAINVDGMPKVEELIPLNGSYVNLEYKMPSGVNIKLLDDDSIYLGTQLDCLINDDEVKRIFGIVAGEDFILISKYGMEGENPELVIYKRR